jgi:hypothetical protein
MHNLDIMHEECNVGESIISTCMSFTDKTKDNHKARRDLAQICNRSTPELNERGGKPRALWSSSAFIRQNYEVDYFEFCKLWSISAFKLVSDKKILNRGKKPTHRYDADGHVRKVKCMVRGHVLLCNLYVVM